MAHIITNRDSKKRDTNTVLKQFGGSVKSAEHREYAECIAARSREAQKTLRKMEGRR